MSRIALSAAATLCLSLGAAHAETLAGLAYADAVRNSPEMAPVDAYKISGKADLMALAARNHDGTVKAIVEIPAGTSAKWEISKDDPHAVYWELKKGAPRIGLEGWSYGGKEVRTARAPSAAVEPEVDAAKDKALIDAFSAAVRAAMAG